MKHHDEQLPFVIAGHAVLGEILRREKARTHAERIARRLGMTTKRFRIHTTHVARFGRGETVESNLPLR